MPARRAQAPVLRKELKLMIYLDNSATTKPCKEAVEAMTNALLDGWANPSALYNFGIDAAYALRTA